MRSLWSALLVSLLVLAGCSSAPAPAPTPPPGPAPVAPAPAPKPAACADWPPAQAGKEEILVWFHCGETPRAVVRPVPAGTEPVKAAYTELVKGPSAEELAAGFNSWFKAETAGALRSVSLADGRLVVDLADVRTQMNGASTSAGSIQLTTQLGRTGAQFGPVKYLEFQMMGDCGTFGDWIQTGCVIYEVSKFR